MAIRPSNKRRSLFTQATPKKSRPRLQFQSLEDRTVPAVILVTSDADTGPGTLRQALATANASVGVFDTINFDVPFFSTDKIITLGSQLAITDPVQIVNPSGPSQVTVEGNNTFSIITSSTNFTLDGLTITKGGTAGGNGGGVTLSAAAAGLTAKNSVFTANTGARGGALFVPSASTALQTFENCTVSNNTGPTGGIYYFGGGALLVKNSTISGNVGTSTANFHGGGIIFYGATTAAGVTIENSTIHGNTTASTTGGGGVHFDNVNTTLGPVVIRNSTITGNTAPAGAAGGGGVGVTNTGAAPTVTVVSTIIAQNTGPAASPDFLANTGTTTATFSLLGVLPTANFTSGTGNLSGTQAVPLNPQLTALQNNTGPTFTRVPLPGSPALNVGSNPAALATDQRGGVRVFNATADMGAAERQAIDAAPAASGAATNVTDGGTSHTFTVTYSDVDGGAIGINTSTVINNNNAILVTGPGGYNQLATYVSINNPANGSPRTVTYSIPAAGGTWDPTDNGTYTITMQANQAKDLDGIAVPTSTLTTFGVDAPVIITVTNDLDAGAGSLRDAIALANADTFAGKIVFDSTFFSTPKTISLDTALPDFSATGGRVILDGPGANLLTIERSATASGGNFRIITSGALDTTIDGVKLTNGFADTANGGGILTTTAGSLLTVTNSVITGNQVSGDAFNAGSGGGVAVAANTALRLQNTAVSGNTATRSGGGVYIYFNGNLLVENSSITGNSTTGGAGYLAGGGGIYFYGAVNTAPAGFTPGTVTIRNSTIANNTSGHGGGGIEVFNLNGNLSLQNTTVTGNQSTDSVGAYYTASGGGLLVGGGAPGVELINSVVSGNTGTTAPDIQDPVGLATIVAASTLVGDPTGGATINDGGGNLPTGTDPQLGSLVSLGLTDGFVPAPTSPLLNVGNNALVTVGVTTDQVGGTHDRIFGAAVDIGAFEVQPPKVAVEQAVGQVDPTNGTSIVFDIVFNMPVADFDSTDVTLTSAVGGTVNVTGSGTTYQATVTGMNGEGVVSLDVAAGVATDVSTSGNAASTSVDGDVYFDNLAPSAVITQASGQNDPTNLSPINFTVTFSEPVTGFTSSDISTAGSTISGVLVPLVTQTGPLTYNVAVFGMVPGLGTVQINFAAGAAADASIGNLSVAPTLSDNVVTFDTVAPSVTVNKASTQADPSGGSSMSGVTFDVVFTEAITGLTTSDFSLTGTTAPGATVTNISGGPLAYVVTVGNMTAGGDVVLSLPANTVTDLAGNNNTASTSTDNNVDFILSGTVQFTSATYTVSEQGSPQLTVDVSRTGGSEGTLTVDYATVLGGSATPGVDYTAASGTLSWTAGDTANKTFNIPILDDSLVEGSETINLALSNVSLAGALGAQATAVATITDYEEGDITFDAASYTVSEGGTATITVKRLNGGDGAVDVTYGFNLGSAEASDYGTANILPGTLSWADGDTADKVITIPVTNDTVNEGRETSNLSLTSPTGGALLGTAPTATLTIAPSDGVKIDATTKFKALTFLDADSDKVIVALGGKTGSLEVFKTDDNGPISLIQLVGTDPLKSSVTVAVVKAGKLVNPAANGFTNIGEIAGTGVRSITALKSVLDGVGINLAGYLGVAKLAGIANGADIIATGTNTQKTIISSTGAIGDNTLIQIGSSLTSLTALSFGDSDIIAPSAGKITIRGNFNGDITLSGAGVNHAKKLKTLAALTVLGVTTNADISVVGNIGVVTTYGFVNSRLFGGYTGPDNGVGGTFNLAIPTTLTSFRSLANVKKGLTGLFDNSSVIASIVTSATLAAVDEVNPSDPFGIFVDVSYKVVSITDTKQKFLNTNHTDQDFRIQIV